MAHTKARKAGIGAILPLAGCLLLAQDVYRLSLSPLDFQADQFHLDRVDQIETNGQHLFLRSKKNTEILAITREGRFYKQIGGAGEHPGEFGFSGVLALSVKGNRLWALDADLKLARLFIDETYRASFRLPSYNVSFTTTASNAFAFSDDVVVIPASPTTQHLASVYRFDGALVKHVGELLPFTQELSAQVPGINDTFWLEYLGDWFSVHKFFPMVTRYDGKFEIIDRFQVESPPIHERLDAIYQVSSRAAMPLPVFTDVKIFGGDLYLMSQGTLHQVDLSSHRVKSMTTFRGEGPDFRAVTKPFVTLYFFVILEGGTCILAHPAMLWNHDLWLADLPFLTKVGDD